MATTIRWVLLLVLLAASSAPIAASAQDSVPTGLSTDEEARMRFELGRRYYDTGRFAEAAHEFAEAHRLSGRTELLYNLFLAYRDAGDDDSAIATLQEYIAALEPGERRTQLESRLHVMEQHRARLAAAAASGDGQTTTDATSTDTTDESTEATSDEGASETPPPAASSGGGLGVAPWVVLGIGGAFIVGSVITGVLALDARSSLDRSCPTADTCPPGFESTRSTGQALAIATDVFWIAGALAVGTGIVLAIMDATSGHAEPAPVTAGVVCTDQGCLAAAQGRF